MAVELESIIPLGRRKKEYVTMFNIETEDEKINILDCGGGPSSFNVEMTKEGNKVVSIDPIYQFNTSQIRGRIDDTFEEMMEQLEGNKEKFLWEEISSVNELRKLRQTAMDMFLKDFDNGLKDCRYIFAELPNLPFKADSFDLALCSHFLFLYSDHLTYEFHEESITEMLRIAKEIRIFPIVDLNCVQSPYVEKIINHFQDKGYVVAIEETIYEFQKGANKLLRISKE